MKVNIPLSTIKGFVGASRKNEALSFNLNNWVDIEKALSIFLHHRNILLPQSNLPCAVFNGQNHDGIYFIKYESHCVVMLYEFC